MTLTLKQRIKSKQESDIPIVLKRTAKGKLYDEAIRIRTVLNYLREHQNSKGKHKTKVSMAKFLGGLKETTWQNMYSGIFRDVEEFLVPSGFILETGRIKIQRGPKSLQRDGMPYYDITKKGNELLILITEYESKLAQAIPFEMQIRRMCHK